MSDHLTLVSPFDPDSRWFAYTAMERNKLLYGFSDAALVVASSADSGGTWAGATEALQHGKVKVFVKTVGVLAPGNSKLVRMGGIPFPPEPWEKFASAVYRPGREEWTIVFSGGPGVLSTRRATDGIDRSVCVNSRVSSNLRTRHDAGSGGGRIEQVRGGGVRP